jgi:MFS transporter, DHA1 family, tetracycline resistance protein
LLGIFILPESLPKEKHDTNPMRLRDYNPIISIAEMARKPGLGWLLLVTSLFNFAFNGINSTSALFLIQKFAAQTWQLSLLMMLAGGSIALVNTFLVPRWMPRFGEKKAGTASLLGLAFFNGIIFFVPALWIVYPLNMLASATSSFTFPSLTTLSIDCVPHREVGLLLGVTTSIGSLMNIFGPLSAGLAYDHVMTGSPYWMGALLLAFSAFMLMRAKTPAEASSTIERSA